MSYSMSSVITRKAAHFIGAVFTLFACLPPELGYRAPSDNDAGDGGHVEVDASDDAPQDAMQDAMQDVGSALNTDGPIEAGPTEAGPLTYAEQVLLDHPSGYWRMGEPLGSTAAKDASGHGATGQYDGKVSLGVKGAIANDSDTAAAFDGATAYVDIGQRFAFSGTASGSVEAWAAPVVDSRYHGILARDDQGVGPSAGFVLYVSLTPTPVYSYQRVQSATTTTGVYSVVQAKASTWAHLVVTYDGSNLIMYVNGMQQQKVATTLNLSGAASNFVIGAEAGGSSSWFLGTLDEVAVYDHALSASRVLVHYHVGVGEPP